MNFLRILFLLLIMPCWVQAQSDTLLLNLTKSADTDDEMYDAYRGDIILELPTAGIEQFYIAAGAGELEIVSTTLPIITVEAEIEIFATNEAKAATILEQEIDLSLEKKNSEAYLTSYISYDQDNEGFKPFEFIKAPYRAINLKIRVPENIKLIITDQSGDIVLAGLSNDIELEDHSGYIYANDINGILDITDNSGDIFLKNINQDIGKLEQITINDNSGEVKILNARGNLDLNDASGGIYIENFTGGVKIVDASDDIRIFDIRGDVEIDDNSGDINGRNIEGHAVITDNSGDIILRKVLLNVNIIEAGSGDLWLSEIAGTISGDLRKLHN